MSKDAQMARFAAETETPSYFIRETTLEKTLDRLREVEPSKRKIIVYAGFHPNEGTDKLSQKYATKWAEKYGATVVCQPVEDTPQAIGVRHGKETRGDASVPLPSDIVPDEKGYAQKFALGDEDVFVVRFHGTPLSFSPGRDKPGLDVITPQNRQITQGLEVTLATSEPVDIAVKEESNKNPEFLENEPNMLLVEYHYKDQPVAVDNPYFKQLLEKEAEAEKVGRVFPLSEESWQRQMKIGLEYIEQPTVSEAGVTDFDNAVVKNFERMLEFIANKLRERPLSAPGKPE